MRILTVRQPWAWAIIHGGKTVENRPRNTAGAYRGPVAIHVAKKWADGWRSSALEQAMYAWALTHPEVHDESTPNPWWLNQGEIIGVVDLVDVHTADDFGRTGSRPGLWPTCSPWAERSGYHLVLENPRPLPEPIAWRGSLGLRELPVEVEKALFFQRRQMLGSAQ